VTVTGDATFGHRPIRDVETLRCTNFNDVFDASGLRPCRRRSMSAQAPLGNFNEWWHGRANDTVPIGNGNTRPNFVVCHAGQRQR